MLTRNQFIIYILNIDEWHDWFLNETMSFDVYNNIFYVYNNKFYILQ